MKWVCLLWMGCAYAGELADCLDQYWGIDQHTIAFIENKCAPLIENHPEVIADFIAKSQAMGIDFTQPLVGQIPDGDGVCGAPEQHFVVFESPFVRVLWGSTLPGVREPEHVHRWKSLMLVIEPADYEMEYPNGVKELWPGEVGVFSLPANERYACTNIGSVADASLRFEVKSE